MSDPQGLTNAQISECFRFKDEKIAELKAEVERLKTQLKEAPDKIMKALDEYGGLPDSADEPDLFTDLLCVACKAVEDKEAN